MISKRALLGPATLMLLVGMSACSSDNATRGTAGDDATTNQAAVQISQSRFGPSEVSVSPGDTVRFTNNDAFAHTVTSKSDAPVEFGSGELGPGQIFEVECSEAGTVRYFCQIHPTIRATIVVG